MKKLFALLTIVLFTSCEEAGVKNPVGDKEFLIQVDSVKYKIKNVNFGEGLGSIYIMVPESSKVSLPRPIGFSDGDGGLKTIIKVK